MTEAQIELDPYILAQVSARDRSAVVKIKFLNFRSRFPNGLVIAVEGDDDKTVYSYWINRVRSDIKYEFYVCNGKREVRNLCNSLLQDQSGQNYEVYYFVDRDFDDLDGFRATDRVFMLDCYSIENYFLDCEVIEETVRVAFPGSGNPEIRARIVELFSKDFNNFLEITSGVNRRVFHARKLGFNIDPHMPTSLAGLAVVNLGKIEPRVPPAEDALPLPPDACPETVRTLDTQFEQLEPNKRHRGKFAYKFLRVWLTLLAGEHKNNELGLFLKAESTNAKINHDEMSLGALAFRSRLPEGFADFVLKLA